MLCVYSSQRERKSVATLYEGLVPFKKKKKKKKLSKIHRGETQKHTARKKRARRFRATHMPSASREDNENWKIGTNVTLASRAYLFSYFERYLRSREQKMCVCVCKKKLLFFWKIIREYFCSKKECFSSATIYLYTAVHAQEHRRLSQSGVVFII